MRDEERVAYAQLLIENPLLHEIIDGIEKRATDFCISANADHETRAAYAAEVRAIRDIRRKLNLASEEANEDGFQAPA